MKGLLLKDAYQTWCYIRWIILVSIAMMLVGTFFMKEGSNFFMLYGGLLLGMSPMTLLAYDQNSRFSAYCAALPVTKEQIVGGKYLIGLCGMVLAELLSMTALAAAQLLWGTVTVQLTVATLLQVAMLTLLGNIILLPLTYRFGYQKARYVYYLCIGLLGGFMGYFVSSGDSALDSILPAQGSLLVLVVVLAFTSCWTHALFYIDAQGVYHRCFAYMIQPIVSYCYVIHTSLHAFVQSRRVESLQKKAIYRTLAFFAIPALVGGTFQVVFSVPGLCVGIMISMLLLYIVCQEQLISTDPLTGLNNRNRFETYMLSLFSNADHTGDVYLLMMDADGFKQINDRYGHVEGDRALQLISTAPKDVCSASGGFIARYGGDEFVVLQKAIAEQDIMRLCEAINDELARTEVPYLLRMSIGYARMGDGVDTW